MYFGNEVVENGISTSGQFQDSDLKHFQACLSRNVKDDVLDELFSCSTLEDQQVVFQKLSSGLEQSIM